MKTDPVLLVEERGFSVQMREWTELEMSFTAGGFLTASDGYCSAEQLQYYGESTVYFCFSFCFCFLFCFSKKKLLCYRCVIFIILNTFS